MPSAPSRRSGRGRSIAARKPVLARALHGERLELWRSAGDQFGIGWALSNLGAVAVLEGDLIEARSLLASTAR